MSNNDIEKRLFELGIINDNTELELLRKENSKLKKDLEQQIEENKILRNNFNETIKNIIEEVRNRNNTEISQPIYPYIQTNPIYYPYYYTSDSCIVSSDSGSTNSDSNILDFSNVNSCNHDNVYSINSVLYDYNKNLNISYIS